ncbi:MAG TPA: GTP cyclohydrolase II [Naasia sp.]|jgi:3,4-dihydroxy 2-butanone 4-phosphate synthase/GTP cyclohydrolase II
MTLASIPEVVAALRAGKPVIVADDEGRENEGDVILAAELATKESLAWTIRHTSGFICAPMSAEIADRLELPVMVAVNQDARGTNYTVSVDAADKTSTGISAGDRAHTLRVLAAETSGPASLIRPGHVLPLRAAEGGVRERAGHTEAAVDLMRIAGLRPVAAIAELTRDDGDMMRLPELLSFGAREGVPVTTIEVLLEHLAIYPDSCPSAPILPPAESPRVRFEVETTVPTVHGAFRMRAYRDGMTGADHVAIVSGEPGPGALIRVHSECLTGEAFGSLKCECGPQLDSALEAIQREGGVVVYLRGHEGRGIGLVNKLRAYRLQEEGLDTLDANLALGLPADARDYGAAAAILADLDLDDVRLLSNNPDKAGQLEAHGIRVRERVPLIVGVTPFNEGYLNAKRDRMGHEIVADALTAALPKGRQQ